MNLESRIAMLEGEVAALRRQVRATFSLARSTMPPIDTGVVQTIQGQIDPISVRDGIPVLMHYGFSSAMPVGGDKVVAHIGDRGNAVVIATGHQTYRFMGLNTGEAVLYDMWGHSIRLTSAGIVINGNVTHTGNWTSTGSITAGYGGGDQVGVQTHNHKDVGTGAGTSAAPTAGT